MILTSTQSKLVLLPLLYLAAFSIFRQIVVPSNPAVILFDFAFTICVFLFCSVMKDKKTFRKLIGESSFDIRDMKCSLLMSMFIILVFCLQDYIGIILASRPATVFYNDWHYVLLVHSLKSLCADVF